MASYRNLDDQNENADCLEGPCIPTNTSMAHHPEFRIRYEPPEPYPPKAYVMGPNWGILEQVSEPIEDKSECICEEIAIPEWDSQFCLRRIHSILTEPEVEEMGDTILALWSIYLRKSPNGLFLRDSDVMACIILQLSNNFSVLEYSSDLLELIIDHLSQGVRIKSSTEALDVDRLAYCFTVLGQTICTGYPFVQQQVLEVLILWIKKVATGSQCGVFEERKTCCQTWKDELVPSNPVPIGAFTVALEKSVLPRMLGDYLKDGVHTNAYCDILHFLRRCCDISPAIIAPRILQMKILDALFLKLCLEDCSNKILSRTIELIYSFLGDPVAITDKIKKKICSHKGTFQILLARFFKQITQFTSKSLLNLRNDTAFLICVLIRNIPKLRKRFGTYLEEILSLMSTNVLGCPCIQIPNIIDSTPEDTEFLRYLVWMFQMIVDSVPTANVIQDYRVIAALMGIVIGPSKLITLMSKVTSIESLQTFAWNALVSIAKKEPKTLLVKEGVPVMMNYLKTYASTGEKDQKTLSMFTHILRIMLNMDQEKLLNENVISFFKKENAISVFVKAIERLTYNNFSSAEEVTLANLLFCSSAMGQYDISNKEAFNECKGVWLLVRLIRQVLYNPAHERHMDPVLHVAIAECTLKCVANSPTCLEVFLGYEGLLRILDLLEISAGAPASLHILSCILELCEYPRCMDQVLYWRRPLKNITQRFAFGDGFNLPDTRIPGAIKPMIGEGLGDVCGDHDHTLSAMLCEIWREEEKRLGVLRDNDGCIGDIERPLLSQFGRSYSRSDENTKKPSNYPGPSCIDMMGSVRPKIFLLVKKITEAVNTEAQLFDGLSLPNQITMQIIINFLDLKRGETWIELMEELKNEKFNLVSTDEKAMKLLVKISKNKVAAVIETQRYLIRRSLEKDEIHERELYNTIQKCHLQGHLEAVREAEYVAKTTDYNYLVERRLWQKAQLQNANAALKIHTNCVVHRTTDGPLNVTVWPSKIKMVQSEPLVDGELKEFGQGDEPEEKELSNVPVQSFEVLPVSSTSSDFQFRESMDMEDRKSLNISLVTGYDAGASPTSAEGGVYQVSPDVLRKALQHLIAKQKKKGWITNVDDDTYWMIRAKWRKDWYPEEQLRLTKFTKNPVNKPFL